MTKRTLGKVGETCRGFELVEFTDLYDTKCSLQQSSIALCEQPGAGAVWLGIDDAAPKILADDARKLGMQVEQPLGWVDYPIPKEVLLTTRMHIDEKMVKALIADLQAWLKTGSFKRD